MGRQWSYLCFHSQVEGPMFEGQHGGIVVSGAFWEHTDPQLEGEEKEVKQALRIFSSGK